jgi:hypothetical protein
MKCSYSRLFVSLMNYPRFITDPDSYRTIAWNGAVSSQARLSLKNATAGERRRWLSPKEETVRSILEVSLYRLHCHDTSRGRS